MSFIFGFAYPCPQQRGHSTPKHGSGPGAACELRERALAVRRGIAALPKDLRVALILAVYEDRTMSDIAEITASSVKTVESRLYRARIMLKEALTAMHA